LIIVEETPNQNFEKAWTYVDHNYAYLIRECYLNSITLLDSAHHPRGADGLHFWYGTYAEITVRNANFSISHFVEVLVHELTHLVQCSSGRVKAGMTEAEMEGEAYPAGRNARQLYELRQMEEIAREMQAAQVARMKRRWAR
jgi:hypothetical protein